MSRSSPRVRGAGPTRPVPVRFSEDELRVIDARASEAGVTRSEWIRRVVLALARTVRSFRGTD